MNIKLKRAYDPPASADGWRVLVDRLWPRGVSKDQAQLDLWLKEIAPSNELRKWFNHEAEKWPEFAQRYRQELKNNAALAELQALARQHATLTLVFAAKDTLHNQAQVLKQALEDGLAQG
ncbi:MAG: DUF488 family protein [Sterolibacterium sp.]|nr:DUF488 family protein [Sterolibacterium sp.]